MNYDAIRNINPSVVTVRGNVAYDKNEQVVSINQDDYKAEVARLQAEHEAEQIQAEADKASAVSSQSVSVDLSVSSATGSNHLTGEMSVEIEGGLEPFTVTWLDSDGNVATRDADWYGESEVVELGAPVTVIIEKQYQ